MKTRWYQRGLSLLLVLASPGLLATDDDPQQWLDRMTAAMSQMSYQGTFVYIQGDNVETMRITHVFDGQGSSERLVSISGQPREIVRDSEGVRWLSGEGHSVMADPAVNRPFFPELPLDDARLAARSYEFKLAGTERVAGHSARLLSIVPKDIYRYGYSLWLDTQSGLLLQWRLTASDGATLAKLMFTELKMGSEVDRAELLPGSSSRALEQVKSGLPPEARPSRGQPGWQAVHVPSGFRLASHRQQEQGKGQVFEHLVYSDGIAVVSVYVESSGSRELDPGLSRLGTTHAFSRKVDDFRVTVVGDVPAPTVQMIAESVGLERR